MAVAFFDRLLAGVGLVFGLGILIVLQSEKLF
jgi:hypothetical protein